MISSSVVSGSSVLVYERIAVLEDRVKVTPVRAGEVSPEIIAAQDARVDPFE